MFWKKKTSPIELELIEEIKRLQKSLAETPITADEYEPTLKAIERHFTLLKDYRPEAVKKDTLITAGAHVLGVGTVAGVEVIGSRLLNRNALSMIRKI